MSFGQNNVNFELSGDRLTTPNIDIGLSTLNDMMFVCLLPSNGFTKANISDIC
jgi:hypothetical protein